MTALVDVLARCVEDRDFLDQLREFPEKTLAQFPALGERDRETLCQRDLRLLDLLGKAYHQTQALEESTDPTGESTSNERTTEQDGLSHAEDDTQPLASPASPQLLAPTFLAVRLVPYASQNETAQLQLNYAAHVDAIAADTQLETLPSPPHQAELGQPLPPLAVRVAVQPYSIAQADGSVAITFDMQASESATSPTHPPVAEENLANVPSPTPIAEAVEAVTSAEDTDRMARLLDLITLLEKDERKVAP